MTEPQASQSISTKGGRLTTPIIHESLRSEVKAAGETPQKPIPLEGLGRNLPPELRRPWYNAKLKTSIYRTG